MKIKMLVTALLVIAIFPPFLFSEDQEVTIKGETISNFHTHSKEKMAASSFFQPIHGRECCIALSGNYRAIERIRMRLEQPSETTSCSDSDPHSLRYPQSRLAGVNCKHKPAILANVWL